MAPVSTSSPVERLVHDVRATRRTLERVQTARAWTQGIGVGLGMWLALWLVSYGMSRSIPTWLAIAVCVVCAASGALWLRARRGGISDVRAALWVEEHGSADFALVTAVEQAPMVPTLWSEAVQRRAEQAISAARAAVTPFAVHALRGPIGFAVGAAMVVALGVWLPSRGDVAAPLGTRDGRGRARVPTPIGAWRVRVTPPEYTGQSASELQDARTVRALSGSRIDVTGSGDAPDSAWTRSLHDSGSVRGQALPISSASAGWQVRAEASDGPSEVRVARDTYSKLLLVDGVADSVPRVALTRPVRDSVLRKAEGALTLSAQLHDDVGLVRASFELVISSGEGERFTVKARQVGARVLQREHDAMLSTVIDLASLQLGPGDVVHIRAIARDAHPAASHEAGFSETRSFRVARPSEYDSVAVEPAPPPEVDKSLLSQRMLLLLTEKLDRRQRTMTPVAFSDESRKLARDQSRLREAVGDAVFQRLTGEGGGEHSHSPGDGHDHGVEAVGGKLALSGVNAEGMLEEGDDSPVIAINKPLLEAYNAMWDAGRALEQSDPHAAIPFMRVALAAIERARAAQRLYLRGRPPTVIIDLDKVRMVGKDTGGVSVRDRRETLPPVVAAREVRLLRAAALVTTDAAAARDSLAVLRLEAVSDSPAFAQSLAALVETLSGGGRPNVTDGFLRARRALGSVQRVAPSPWTRGGPP